MPELLALTCAILFIVCVVALWVALGVDWVEAALFAVVTLVFVAALDWVGAVK